MLLPRPAPPATVTDAWDRGDAVAVLDPTAPAVRPRAPARRRAARPTSWTATARRPFPAGRAVPAGTAAVVTTSGTTGDPKAVELTTAGLEAIGDGFATALGAPPDDRWLVCLPLHHVAGLAILARACVTGAALTVHDGFDLDDVAAAPSAKARPSCRWCRRC